MYIYKNLVDSIELDHYFCGAYFFEQNYDYTGNERFNSIVRIPI